MLQFVAVISICTLFLNSCATVFKGSKQRIAFNADISAVKVYINGQLVGSTPFELQLDSRRTYNVEFRKDGYSRKTIILTNSVHGGYLVLDVVTSVLLFIPVIVDAATGHWYVLDEDSVTVVLEKEE